MRHFLLKYLHITQIVVLPEPRIQGRDPPGRLARPGCSCQSRYWRSKSCNPPQRRVFCCRGGRSSCGLEKDIFTKFDSDYKVTGHIRAQIRFLVKLKINFRISHPPMNKTTGRPIYTNLCHDVWIRAYFSRFLSWSLFHQSYWRKYSWTFDKYHHNPLEQKTKWIEKWLVISDTFLDK